MGAWGPEIFDNDTNLDIVLKINDLWLYNEKSFKVLKRYFNSSENSKKAQDYLKKLEELLNEGATKKVIKNYFESIKVYRVHEVENKIDTLLTKSTLIGDYQFTENELKTLWNVVALDIFDKNDHEYILNETIICQSDKKSCEFSAGSLKYKTYDVPESFYVLSYIFSHLPMENKETTLPTIPDFYLEKFLEASSNFASDEEIERLGWTDPQKRKNTVLKETQEVINNFFSHKITPEHLEKFSDKTKSNLFFEKKYLEYKVQSSNIIKDKETFKL